MHYNGRSKHLKTRNFIFCLHPICVLSVQYKVRRCGVLAFIFAIFAGFRLSAGKRIAER